MDVLVHVRVAQVVHRVVRVHAKHLVRVHAQPTAKAVVKVYANCRVVKDVVHHVQAHVMDAVQRAIQLVKADVLTLAQQIVFPHVL